MDKKGEDLPGVFSFEMCIYEFKLTVIEDNIKVLNPVQNIEWKVIEVF